MSLTHGSRTGVLRRSPHAALALLLGVGAALGGSLAASGRAAAAGTDALSFGESATATVGANAVVRIDGRLTYETACGAEGVPDFVYPATDVYLVTGAPAGGGRLTDAAGGPPNTIVSTASMFIGEIIAITSPTGSLDEGTYSVVYDTCQDGRFDPLVDTVFADALTVRLPAVLPSASMAIVDLKGAAEEEAYSWTRAHALFETIEAIEGIPDLVGCMMSPDPDCITGILLGEATGGFSLTGGVTDGFKTLLVSQAKHYAAIAADPPDPQFRQVTTIAPVPSPAPGDGQPLNDAMAASLVPIAGESALAEALLHAVERYQGAQAAGDAEWALTHARQAADLSAALAVQTEASSQALQDLREAVDAAPGDIDGAYAAVRDHVQRVWYSGFTPDERRGLANLGLSPAEIAARETETRRAYPMPPVTRARIVAQLDELVDAHTATAGTLGSATTAFGALAEQLEAQPAVPDVAPTADAGGPYTATAAGPVTVDGSGSTTPDGSIFTAFEWDLDADGAFDDATGATPSATFPDAGAHVVGLRVTNSLDRQSVGYATVLVGPAGAAPTVPDGTPGSPNVVLTVGSPQEFTVAADGARWLLDGTGVGTGPSFTYDPAAASVGRHVLEARLPDSAAGRRWDVTVTDVDGDADGWTITSDCADDDAAISPGVFELLGNDVDDDCDSGTPDAPPGGLTGTPWTWGADFLGAGGIGPISGDYIRPPREMTGFDDVVQVERGFRMGFIVRADGRILGWGSNFYGELGDGTATHRNRPVPVLGVNGATPELTGVVEVSTGGSSPHSAALRSDGTVVAWGENRNRQLGDGSTANYKAYPVPVLSIDGSPLSGVRSVEAGSAQNYATMDDGSVQTWGMSHCSGGGTLVTHPLATPLPSLGTGVRQISSGYNWTMFRMADGSVLSCGGNTSSLGRTLTQTERPYSPHQIATFGPGSGVVDVTAGNNHGVALKSDGSVWTWGWYGNGSLDVVGGTTTLYTPVQVPLPPGPPVVDVEAAEACHTQALRADGSILIWGCDTHGSSGIVPAGTVKVPTVLQLPAAAIATSASMWNGLALARPVVDTAWERPAPWVEAEISDAEGTESDPGGFEVTLSEVRPHDVTVAWSVSPGTAGDGDLRMEGGTTTIPAGQTSVTVPAPVVDDALHEGDETYTVTLTGISHGITPTRSQAGGTVHDDDAAPTVGVEDLEVAEGHTSLTDAVVGVSLSAPSALPVTVVLETSDGTATTPGDYSPTTLTITIPPGDTGAAAHVPVHGDTAVEPDETFGVRLTSAEGAALGAAQAQVTIRDDEPLALAVSSPTVREGDGGTTDATFTVTLDPPAPEGTSVSVPWTVASGTADLPDDVSEATGTLVFEGGRREATVTAGVVGDDQPETTEVFRLVLGDPVSSEGRLVLPADTAVAFIEDDDPADVAPTVDAGGDLTGTEGVGVALTATVTDPDSTPAVQWSAAPGAGTDPGATCTFSAPTSAATGVSCTDDGSYVLTATADDGVNPPVTDDVVLTLANAAPAVPSLDVTVAANGARLVEVPFTDVVNDTHTCTFGWGDGTPDTVVQGAQAPCRAEHAYAAGTHTVTVTVVDDDGGRTGAERSLLVHAFSGFFGPVQNPPVMNAVNAGRAIPIVFGLGGYQGMDVFTPGHPASRPVPCTPGAGAGSPTATPGNSALSYARGNQRYHYDWKTEASWAGTCRELVLRFADGTERTALFSFR